MIERYSITAASHDLEKRFGVDVPAFYQPHFNAAPTQLLPVVTAGSAGLSNFFWGTSPEWSKNKMLGEKIINTRGEDLDEKPALKRSLMKTRCLIPADGFYAWKKVGKKTNIPYRFTFPAGDLFGIGGLWEEFEDTEGNQVQTFAMITTLAGQTISSVCERMPLILPGEAEDVWLDTSATEEQIFSLLKDHSTGSLIFYPVSPGIRNTSHDYASMILPTPPSDQHGNLTLFD